MSSDMVKTLPASWYYSKSLYEMERQSVFLRSWYLVGPVTKWADRETVEYEFAGVKLAVKKADDASFFARKLPDDSHLPLHRTSTGLLFVALSPISSPSSTEGTPLFDTFFPGLSTLLSTVDFTRLPFRRTLSYTGRFNWKTMVDGYQECLHCQYTHRAFSLVYPPTFYTVHNHDGWSRHVANPEKPDDGLFLYFFPNCTLNVYGGGMSCFRICPTADPGVTRMEFDYYNIEMGEKFEKYFRFVRKVAQEDYDICQGVQENLEKGVYCQGLLNPEKETGVSHYQQMVRKKVMEKWERMKGSETPSVQADSVSCQTMY